MKFAKPPCPPLEEGEIGGFEKYFLVIFLKLRDLMSYNTVEPWR
jgi:hypothetical protein